MGAVERHRSNAWLAWLVFGAFAGSVLTLQLGPRTPVGPETAAGPASAGGGVILASEPAFEDEMRRLHPARDAAVAQCGRGSGSGASGCCCQRQMRADRVGFGSGSGSGSRAGGSNDADMGQSAPMSRIPNQCGPGGGCGGQRQP